MIDWLNDNAGAVEAASAVVLAVTLVFVAYYAYQTRKQAEASVRMVKEMREQGLARDRPLLLVDLLGYKGTGKLASGTKTEECYPDSMSFRVTNFGPGPAIDVEMTVLHPRAHYWRSAPKGYLLKDEPLPFDTSESIYPPSGSGLSDSLRRCGVDPALGGALGFVARYRDVHGRFWLAWMRFDYDMDADEEGNAIWWIEQRSQHVQQLTDGAVAESWHVLFGGSVAPRDR